jgi:broad specificity phosphatase PhoE
MFDLIQTRSSGGALSRTTVYLIAHGESTPRLDGLSEVGMEQISELARSRLIAGPKSIFSSPRADAWTSAQMLGDELMSDVVESECLSDVSIGNEWTNQGYVQKHLPKMWDDTSYEPPGGESLLRAQKRVGECISTLARRNPESSIAVVTHPLVYALFYTLVVGGEADMQDWLDLGFASCSCFEYSKDGWTLVMPTEDSFLSQPSNTAMLFPDSSFQK